MRAHFAATVGLLRGEGRLIRAALLLAFGLLLLIGAIRYGLLLIITQYIPYLGYVVTVVGAPFYTIGAALPGLVLLHAIAQRASGHPVPFRDSCKAVLYRLPSWLAPALIVYAVHYALTRYAALSPFAFFQLEFFGLIFEHPFGGFVDAMAGYLGTALVLYIAAAAVLARLMLLIPAFTVLDGYRFDTARRLSPALTAWRDVRVVAPFLLLLFLAAHIDLWGMMGVATGRATMYLGHTVQMVPDIVISTVIRTLMQQTAIALLLLATLPAWIAVRENAAERAAEYEQDRGGLFTRKRFPLLGYTGIALAVIAVHAAVMAFFVLEILSIAGAGRGLLLDSREAMESSIIPIVASLPLLPIALLSVPVDIRYGGVAWAVVIIALLEGWRRYRRYSMRAAHE